MLAVLSRAAESEVASPLVACRVRRTNYLPPPSLRDQALTIQGAALRADLISPSGVREAPVPLARAEDGVIAHWSCSLLLRGDPSTTQSPG
jgi:hypothetical protein